MPEDAGGAQIPYRYELALDARTQRSIAGALFKASFRTPWPWVIILVVLLVVEVMILQGSSVLILVPGVVLVALVIGLTYLNVRRRIVVALPVGRTLKTGFGESAMATTDGQNSAIVAYASLEAVTVQGDVVWLVSRPSRRRFAYPRELFPDIELDKMRSAIAANPASAA